MDENVSEAAVRVERGADGIAVVTIDRAARMNALNGQVVREIEAFLARAAYDASIRVVIITGAGDRAFSAGADLKERATMGAAEVKERLDDCARVFGRLATLPKPTIAAINGFALGGGLELALCCDLRVVAEGASVGLTETRLGIIPGAGGTQRLARLIGPARAKEMIFCARRVSGAEAYALGIANACAPRAELLARARALAAETLGSGPIALAQAKLAIDAGLDVDLATGLRIERAAYDATIPTEDRIEGLAAFREKRAPRFTGQ